jgi:hypothetical protein
MADTRATRRDDEFFAFNLEYVAIGVLHVVIADIWTGDQSRHLTLLPDTGAAALVSGRTAIGRTAIGRSGT